ncbi:DUF559 domain-containing protein [Pseudonocardia endophytica]|uniref:Uncharacterized protein DUF559 n=1 Tax=Pseudonocardia endophytica TaxID=401976 RepID=A0A4V2PHL4_PSEEN|nr:DUF559 domain-containing protein [Pseudonocardia endophytica]TCK21166.1 uncharacterized protein DUF559 [Pseudonocardia endophytica]
MTVPGWPTVFRGSDAVAAGLVTWARLLGPGFERLLPDTYAAAGHESGLLLRSVAASRWSRGRGVLSGYSAAEVQEASCGPLGAPAEITVAEHVLRSRAGVTVRRGELHPDEVTMVDGLLVTTPLRTAFDLGRRLEFVEAVVAVDALARVHRFPPDLLLGVAVRYPRRRGVSRLTDVLSAADARSSSPPETRLRLVLTGAGLPRPAVQHPVLDDDRRRAVWLDLAYPRHRLGIEYDGGDHLDPKQVVKDIERHTRLAAAGWRVLRYTARDIRRDPGRIVREVGAALTQPAAG